MTEQQYFLFDLELGGGRVLMATDDTEVIPWIVGEVAKRIPGCELKPYGDGWQRIQRLRNRDDEVGEWIRKWLLGAGWSEIDRKSHRGREVGPIYWHYVFRRSTPPAHAQTRIPDIGDQLEKLASLRKSGAISDKEFEVAKSKLLAS
jgi:hypothetical protein